jgi:adenine specific DNA methylase Mod
MGNYFDTDILFRMKQVLCGYGKNEPCGISKEIDWQGGGFFKYYELEQYEDALANCKYEDGDLLMLRQISVSGICLYERRKNA